MSKLNIWYETDNTQNVPDYMRIKCIKCDKVVSYEL